MLLGIILCMSFDFGNNISITYQNSPKSVFYLFLWVQAFGLVSFGIMLFFGPSFSHLACYFNHFFYQNQVFFSKLKKVSFGKSKLGYIKLGKTAGLVIFMLIYDNLCNC